jgi:hypothetical protein
MSKASTSKARIQKARTVTVGLFDLLNQALSEFIHTEHIDPQSFSDSVEACIQNKKAHPGAVDPIIFAFSDVSNPPEGLFMKYIELLRARYLRNISQIFATKQTDFARFHRFMVKQAVKTPELFDFLSSMALTAAETESQNLAMLFMKTAFSLYSPYLMDVNLIPHVVTLTFAHTESDETSRDIRVSEMLNCITDVKIQYVVLAHAVMQERIFSSKLCDLYASFIEKGLEQKEYQEYAVHILRYLAPIKDDLLHQHLPKIAELVNDDRTVLQAALVQLLVDASQEALLTQVIEHTDKIEILSLSLHLVSELGTISSPLLISLFKKIGTENIEQVCTERCTVETPVGPLQLSRLTNTWNSAAVNATVIEHIQNVPLAQWDVEFALCKLLLKQPMDSTSAQIWKQLFATLAPQFGELMREEDMTEIIFDIVNFYLVATSDIEFFENLQPYLEPVVTVAKEKCKAAGTKFLTKVAELGPKFKQIVSTLILV